MLTLDGRKRGSYENSTADDNRRVTDSDRQQPDLPRDL